MRDCEVMGATHEPTHPWPLPGGELVKRAPTLAPLLRRGRGWVHGPNSRPILEVFASHEPPLSRPAATLSPPCGERAGRGVPIWFMASIHVRILEVFPPLTLPTPSSWGEGNISGPLMVAV